jgi:hypothetical protein
MTFCELVKSSLFSYNHTVFVLLVYLKEEE